MNKTLNIRIMINESFGRFGMLEIAGRKIISCERWWADNLPYQSCIPMGTYKLQPHFGRHGEGFAFVNHKLGVYQSPEPGALRYACVIHPANYPVELMGCMSFGDWFLSSHRRLGVGTSRDSTAFVLDYIRRNGITHIAIRDKDVIPVYELPEKIKPGGKTLN